MSALGQVPEFDEEDRWFFEKDLALEYQRLCERHRIDMAKMLLDKDGGYTIREFKRWMKAELKENP